MKKVITEAPTTTTTTAAPAAQTYGKVQNCTRNLTDTGQERYGFGYLTGNKNKTKANLVVVSVYPEVNGVVKCAINDGKKFTYGEAQCNDMGPSILASLDGEETPTQCVRCNAGTISADAWNLPKADVLGQFSERKEMVSQVEGAINEEEKQNLEYYRASLGSIENEFNNWNSAFQVINNYIKQYDGQSVYFGFFKSALVALVKTLKYEMAQNKKSGKEDLNSEKRNKLNNIDAWFEALPEKNMTDPQGYTMDDINSRFDKVSMKEQFPYKNLQPRNGIPFDVYVPYSKLKGRAAAEASISQTGEDISENTLTVKSCIDAFQNLACNLSFTADKRINKACKIPGAVVTAPPPKMRLETLKETVAQCQVQGFYDEKRKNKKMGETTRRYLNYIQEKFFSANGAFSQPTANPCAYVNLQITQGQGKYTEKCYPKQTIETQRENYSIKNNISKLLFEARNEKKQQILENKIIESNFMSIIESINKPVRHELKNSVDKVLTETRKYMAKKYDRELIQENLENFLTVLTGLFGGEQEIKNTFVDKVISEILVNVGFEKDSEFTKEVVNDVVKGIDLDNIPSLLTNPDALTVKIAEAIPMAYSNSILNQDQKSGVLGNIQTTMHDALLDKEITKKLTSMLSGPVRQALEGMESKMGSKLENWKESFS
jgi:hypothetical protein